MSKYPGADVEEREEEMERLLIVQRATAQLYLHESDPKQAHQRYSSRARKFQTPNARNRQRQDDDIGEKVTYARPECASILILANGGKTLIPDRLNGAALEYSGKNGTDAE